MKAISSRDMIINYIKMLFISIIENEKLIESNRIALYTNKLFDYSTLCERLDAQKIGLITPNQIRTFLLCHSINAPNNIIKILFNYYGDIESKNNNLDKYFSYESFNSFLYPKTYISSRISSINSKGNLSYDLEQKVCKILLNEFGLINEVTKILDLFYLDGNFMIFDIIKFFNNGKENNFINELFIEKFCIKYNIRINHNELKFLLYFLGSDSEQHISYNQLKKLFRTFILNLNSIDAEQNNKFFIYTLNSYSSEAMKNVIKQYSQSIPGNIELNEFLKQFIDLEYILYVQKKKLYLCEDLIPIELFYLFDTKDRNFFTMQEFKSVLAHYFGISATLDEIKIIFYNYSISDDEKNNSLKGVMNFNCFRKLLLPFDCLELPDKNILPELKNISFSTKNLLINFFQTLCTNEKKIDDLKTNFNYSKNFSPYEQFLKLKGIVKKVQQVNKSMLLKYLENNLSDNYGINSIEELKKKIEPLYYRIDKDGDLLISFEDFSNFIRPFNTNI